MTTRAASRWLVLAALTAWSPLASADPVAGDSAKEECRLAYERGQVERTRGHLRAAATSFRTCSRAECAAFMRSDCAHWIDEVNADLPTLVIAVRDARGADVPGARLLVDGEPRPELAEGIAIPVDPGEHRLRAEAPGAAPAESRVVVRVGERQRRIELRLGSTESTAAPAPVAHAPVWPTYALGGLAVAGLGMFAGFAIAGRSIEVRRSDTCAPGCTDAQVSPIHTDYRLADAGLGIAIASAAAALVYTLVTSGHAAQATADGARVDSAIVF